MLICAFYATGLHGNCVPLTLFSYLPLSSLLPPTLPLLNPTFSPHSFFVSCNYTPHSADSSALAKGVTWVSLHMARCSIIAATSLFSPECLANPVIWDARVRRSSQSCTMSILGVPDWYCHYHISALSSFACKTLSSISPNSLSLTSLQGVEVWSLKSGRLSRRSNYRGFFFTGTPLKVLCVRLHIKSHQKSSKCQNLLTEKKLVIFRGVPVKKNTLYFVYTLKIFSKTCLDDVVTIITLRQFIDSLSFYEAWI